MLLGNTWDAANEMAEEMSDRHSVFSVLCTNLSIKITLHTFTPGDQNMKFTL